MPQTPWSVRAVEAATMHSTQKPVECMRPPMLNNSAVGETVCDPFLGSGTTITAAELTGRSRMAMEISPADCDVAVLRMAPRFAARACCRGAGAVTAAVEYDRGMDTNQKVTIKYMRQGMTSAASHGTVL